MTKITPEKHKIKELLIHLGNKLRCLFSQKNLDSVSRLADKKVEELLEKPVKIWHSPLIKQSFLGFLFKVFILIIITILFVYSLYQAGIDILGIEKRRMKQHMEKLLSNERLNTFMQIDIKEKEKYNFSRLQEKGILFQPDYMYDFQKIVALNPIVQPLLQKGIFALVIGEYDIAINELEKARKHLKDSSLILEALADAYTLTGRFNIATVTYEDALALNPKEYQLLYKLAFVKYKEKEFEEAKNRVLEAIEIQKTPEAYTILAGIFIELGNLGEAENAFLNVLKLDPNDFEANQFLSLYLFCKKNDPIHAIVYLEKAVELKPNKDDFLVLAATYEQIKGQEKKAIEYYKQYIMYGGTDNIAYQKILSTGDIKEMSDPIDTKSLLEKLSSPPILVTLGFWDQHEKLILQLDDEKYSLEKMQDELATLEVFQGPIKCGDLCYKMYEKLVNVDEDEANGYLKKALNSYKDALSINKDKKGDVWFKIAMVYRELGNIDKFFDSCGYAIAENPDLYEVYIQAIKPTSFEEKIGWEPSDFRISTWYEEGANYFSNRLDKGDISDPEFFYAYFNFLNTWNYRELMLRIGPGYYNNPKNWAIFYLLTLSDKKLLTLIEHALQMDPNNEKYQITFCHTKFFELMSRFFLDLLALSEKKGLSLPLEDNLDIILTKELSQYKSKIYSLRATLLSTKKEVDNKYAIVNYLLALTYIFDLDWNNVESYIIEGIDSTVPSTFLSPSPYNALILLYALIYENDSNKLKKFIEFADSRKAPEGVRDWTGEKLFMPLFMFYPKILSKDRKEKDFLLFLDNFVFLDDIVASAALKIKDYETAERWYNYKLGFLPESSVSRIGLATIYLKDGEGRIDEAIQILEQCLSNDLNNERKAEVYFRLAVAYIVKEKYNLGVNFLRNSVLLNPKDEVVRQLLYEVSMYEFIEIQRS